MYMTYCNAGHNPPFYWDSKAKKILDLTVGGTFVGQFADVPFSNGEISISENDKFLAYTDGVTESEDVDRNLFGSERLKESFINNINDKPEDYCKKIKDWVDRFSEGTGDETIDDFTLIQIAIGRD